MINTKDKYLATTVGWFEETNWWLPTDYSLATSLKKWRAKGMSMKDVDDAISITKFKGLDDKDSFRYCCGVMSNKIKAKKRGGRK